MRLSRVSLVAGLKNFSAQFRIHIRFSAFPALSYHDLVAIGGQNNEISFYPTIFSFLFFYNIGGKAIRKYSHAD